MFSIIHDVGGSEFAGLALALGGVATLVLAVKDFVAELRPMFGSSRAQGRAKVK